MTHPGTLLNRSALSRKVRVLLDEAALLFEIRWNRNPFNPKLSFVVDGKVSYDLRLSQKTTYRVRFETVWQKKSRAFQVDLHIPKVAGISTKLLRDIGQLAVMIDERVVYQESP